MVSNAAQLSRISKLFVDRDELTTAEALARRRAQFVTLYCGSDVAASYNLQVAVMTAANIAVRCFPGAVCVRMDDLLASAPLLLWPGLGLTFGQAVSTLVSPTAVNHNDPTSRSAVVFGDAVAPVGALRVTFDGWIAAVGPAATVSRLPERAFCALSGVLAGALAISELFMSFAGISVEASRRSVALSLWQPELDVRDPAALGVPVQFLPDNLWTLGVGHLGNAYLWALAALPYQDPDTVEVFLNDFDRVEPENADTGLLFTADLAGRYKTRVASAWLEERGFRTRIIERRFEQQFRSLANEPGLALCGFDSNPARRALDTAGFVRVVDSGLGGTSDNFDTIAVHTLPNPRPASEIWPDVTSAEEERDIKRRARAASRNRGYLDLAGDECGRFELAGKSVAVPFVGAAASTLVLAEVLRLYHDGPAYTDLKLRLATPGDLAVRRETSYRVEDIARLSFTFAKKEGDEQRRSGDTALQTS